MPSKRTRDEGSEEPGPDLDRGTDKKRRKDIVRAQWEKDANALAAGLTALTVLGAKPGPGDLQVVFLDVGQGDCTLITTPAGRRIMIDCGFDVVNVAYTLKDKNDTEKEAKKRANERKRQTIWCAVQGPNSFLGTENHLHALILTHPDLDHNNAVSDVLLNATIGSVYHSGSFGDYQWQTRTRIDSATKPDKSDPNKDCASGPVKRVVCRGKYDKEKLTGVDVRMEMFKHTVVYGDKKALDDKGATGIDILQPNGLVIWKEPDCTVTILAGDVIPNTYRSVTDDSGVVISDGTTDGANTGSLVTLIEVYGQKLLFCGDATRSTEAFLLAEHADLIAGVDWMPMPHHGSSDTSSTPAFIRAVQPKNVVISAGRAASTKYHHPRWAAVRRYLAHYATTLPAVDTTGAGNPVIFWEGGTANEDAQVKVPAGAAQQTALGMASVSRLPGPHGCYSSLMYYPVRQTGFVLPVRAGGGG